MTLILFYLAAAITNAIAAIAETIADYRAEYAGLDPRDEADAAAFVRSIRAVRPGGAR